MSRAWMVRAGADGEREGAALAEGRAIAGWKALADISGCGTRADLKEAIRRAYGEETSSAVLGNWSGQLWRFLRIMEPGDIIVMPLKKVADTVAIGRIAGDYYYDAAQPEGFRHSRRVEWVRPAVSRSELGSDLLSSLGSLLTVCELSRRDAARRLSEVSEGRADPGWQASEGDSPPASLSELVASAPRFLTVREVLDYWGYRRRTARIVEEVTDELTELGLLAVPSIAEGWIDGRVEIVPMPGQAGDSAESTSTASGAVDVAESTAEAVIGGSVPYSVSTIDTAKRAVMAFAASDALATAVTKMALNDYSQAAVTDDRGNLLGCVSWESIALAWTSGKPSAVKDAMRAAPSTSPEDDLLGQIDQIYKHGFVFVRGPGGEVQGIITGADLSRRFGNDHRPIVLLDEIERRLSNRVMGPFTPEELKEHGVAIKSYGATLGNYVTALSKEAVWDKLGWAGLDRAEFHQQMVRVRDIRNQLMHFSPDPITPIEIELLENTARVLRLVTTDLHL